MNTQVERQLSKNADRKYKIVATRKAANDYSFRLTAMNGQDPNLVFNKTKDNMKERDYYLLEFHLDNEQGCQLEFVNDRAKVLSACRAEDAVNNCAPEGSELPSVFYVHPTKKIGKNLLYVINSNPLVEDFFFGFSFVSKDGTESAYFDPGGSNQNAGSPFMSASLISGAVTGGAVALGTTALIGAANFAPATAIVYAVGGAVAGLVIGLLVNRF